CVVVPGRVGDGGKVVRARIGLFAAAILILELEPERLARIKTVEHSVERRGRGHPQRGTHDGRRLFELEEGCERRLWRARPPAPARRETKETPSGRAARPPARAPAARRPPGRASPLATRTRPRAPQRSTARVPHPPPPRNARAARARARYGSPALSHRASTRGRQRRCA